MLPAVVESVLAQVAIVDKVHLAVAPHARSAQTWSRLSPTHTGTNVQAWHGELIQWYPISISWVIVS